MYIYWTRTVATSLWFTSFIWQTTIQAAQEISHGGTKYVPVLVRTTTGAEETPLLSNVHCKQANSRQYQRCQQHQSVFHHHRVSAFPGKHYTTRTYDTAYQHQRRQGRIHLQIATINEEQHGVIIWRHFEWKQWTKRPVSCIMGRTNKAA